MTQTIDPLVQTAAETYKPKKQDAVDLIRSLSKQFDTDSDQFNQLAKLYTYFLPPKPESLKQIAKSPFAWVAAATSDHDDPREYLRYVYSDGTRMMGTNGQRVHIVQSNREAGYYCPSSGERVHDQDHWRYADVDRVLGQPHIMAPISDYTQEPLREMDKKNLVIDVSHATPTSTTPSIHIASRYLHQALAAFDSNKDRMGIVTATDRHGQPESQALRIESDDGSALAYIMGVRK